MSKTLIGLSRDLQFNRIENSDLKEINDLYVKSYSHLHLPNLLNSIGDGVIRNSKGKMIAMGLVKLKPECYIMINKDADMREQSAALIRLATEAAISGKHGAFDELYALTFDPQYSELLIKHLGFEYHSGTLLRMEI